MINLNLVESVDIAGVDFADYPDFCDAYIEYAEYDGVEMTCEQLAELNDMEDFVYDCILDSLY